MTVHITFSIIERHDMHPIYGVPQLQHDQLNIIARHIDQIKQEINTERFVNESDEVIPIMNKLTRKVPKERKDWPEWQSVEHKQLDL